MNGNDYCRKWILGASVSGLLCMLTTSKAANGLEIQFRSLDGFDRYPQAKDALFEAARAWESHVDDPVTVQLDVRFASPFELGTDGVAFSDIPTTELDYSDFRSLLQADRTSMDDETAIQHLPSGPLLSFRTRDSQGNVNIDAESEVINRRISLTFPNARALGLDSFAEDQIDASIAFNELFAVTEDFDFDRSDGIDGISFVATATHEIGHALGFVSGIDYLDSITLPNGPSAPTDARSEAVLTSLDLFRYSAESVPLIDVSVGTETFLSIDGGATSLAQFSTGQFNGDGQQAMHWMGDSGIMGPLTTPGRPTAPARVDLQAMDVIGWDVIVLPEPSPLRMFAFGIAAMFVRWRLRGRGPSLGMEWRMKRMPDNTRGLARDCSSTHVGGARRSALQCASSSSFFTDSTSLGHHEGSNHDKNGTRLLSTCICGRKCRTARNAASLDFWFHGRS